MIKGIIKSKLNEQSLIKHLKQEISKIDLIEDPRILIKMDDCILNNDRSLSIIPSGSVLTCEYLPEPKDYLLNIKIQIELLEKLLKSIFDPIIIDIKKMGPKNNLFFLNSKTLLKTIGESLKMFKSAVNT